MLEVLREDYIRTARAKGLRELIVLLRHALKNAAIPVVTIIGLTLAALVGGLVVTEAVFAIPGVGRLIVDSILRRDYPVIQGVMLMVTVGFLAINLMVDMLYGFLDPKIRY
jgi:peptide/nickel transport system permease protein